MVTDVKGVSDNFFWQNQGVSLANNGDSFGKISDVVRSRILTEKGLEHIKTHIHFNLTRFPHYAAVRSEIETFLEARQSSSNPDAMDIGSLNGQKGVWEGVCRNCGQQGHWAADCPKRDKNGRGGKGEDGKGQGKKGKSGKGKLLKAKERAKVASGKHARHLKGIALTVGHGVTWKRIVSQKPRPRVVKAKVLAVSMNPRQVDQKTLQLADLVCARLETNVMTGNGTIIAK